MNNEPIAWMETYKGEPNNLDWDKSNLNYGSEFHDVVPLYTHPVNSYQSITNTKIEPTVVSYTNPIEPTDEEINVIAILQDAEIVPVGHEIWKTGEEFNKYKKIVFATAKALRKASEK